MEYNSYSVQDISDNYFRIGFFAAMMLMQRICTDYEIESFEAFINWLDDFEIENCLEKEWEDAEILLNSVNTKYTKRKEE